MNLKKIFIRSQNLLINPGSEFSLIAEERPEQPGITRNFTLPMSLLVALFALLGSAFSNITLPINSFLYVVFNAVIVFFMILTHTYLSGKAISLLGRNISPADKPSVYYALSAYSQLPFFLILLFLIVLSFYSALLFHTGCGILTGIPRGKKLQFTLLSVLIIITSFIICSELYTLLYTEIMEQFSTFVVY